MIGHLHSPILSHTFLKHQYQVRPLPLVSGRSSLQLIVDVLIYSNNTFYQGVSNDGGSHVEMSSICAVPLGII